MKPTIQLPPYPEELTQWWWNQAVQKWPDHGEEKVLNLLREEIVRQSNRFNKSRDFDPSAYGARDLSLLAYGNFYTPRTLDACDDSAKSLAFLRRIHREAQHLWPDTRISTDRMDIRHLSSSKPTKTKANYDLILSSYAFNECWEGENQTNCTEILSTIGSLLREKGQLVWIEPAEGQVCRALHAASAQATKESERLFLQAPYFHGMPCPLLQNESKYFSHEVRPCSPSSEVERINRPLNLEIREVKFGFTILSKTQPRSFPNEAKVLRIISPVRKRKGTLSFWGIGTDGKETEYEWQRRNLEKGEQKSILELQRGDVIQISEVVNTEEKRVRIAQADQISPVFLPRWEKRS